MFQLHVDSEETARWVIAQLRKVAQLSGGGGVSVTNTSDGIFILGQEPRGGGGGGEDVRLVSLVAAGASDGLYQAKEIRRKSDGSDWELTPDGLVWDGTDEALPEVRELGGQLGLEVAIADGFAPALVRPTLTAGGKVEWVFSAGGAFSCETLSEIDGYNETKIQFLGHDSTGVCRWYDVENC